MMYSDKLVLAIKANGKVLRETKDLVHLPFGSEFSVLVKNLNSRRAKFRLHIDGTDVLDGTEIIVAANSQVEMKRFIRNGNMNEGNAFKFIERTLAIEDGPRGIKVDDGVVRVEFWFEKAPVEQAIQHVTTVHHYHTNWLSDFRIGGRPYYGAIGTSNPSGTYSSTGAILRSKDLPSAPSVQNAVLSDVGITVPGAQVDQKFSAVYGFNSEVASNVIILRIEGKIGTTEITAPLTVKSKQKCETCGHVNKSTSKFCTECGTSLVIL